MNRSNPDFRGFPKNRANRTGRIAIREPIGYTERGGVGAKLSGREPTFLLGGGMNQLDRIREIADRVAVAEGMELVDVEFAGRGPHAVLRIFLDKPGGITLRDCEVVSRQVGAILDVEDFIPTRYTLEVSSPGLDRRLAKPADYERFAGRQIQLVLKTPFEGRRRFCGRLRGIQEGKIQLEEENGPVLGFDYAEILKANLVIEL